MSDLHQYFAFISYSRKDSKAAAWLQKRLEWFRFPVKLVPEERRPPHNRYIRPVYRDKTNLEVTDEHYWTNIRQALEHSRYLVVLCSPHSAKSEPVSMEVRHFLQAHGGDTSRVVPVILSGNVISSGEDAALCPALRDLGEELINRNLPSMVADTDTAERDAWESGFVALSSYLLQLQRSAIGDHIQRESRKQARKLRLWLGAVVALGLMAGMAGLYAWQQKDRAEASEQKNAEALHETQRQLERSWLEEGRAWLERARIAKGEKDHLKALMLAGRAVGFVGYGRKETDTPEIEEAYPPLLGRPFKDKEAEKERQEEVKTVQEFVDSVSPWYVPIWSSPIQQHHGSEVASVAFSPDGTRLASGSDDNTIKLWDAATGQELVTLQGHSEGVASVAFSPDGTRLASGSDDNTIKLWDAETGRELATLKGHSAAITSVAFSPDGTRLASGSSEWNTPGEIKLWDAISGREVATLQGHSNGVSSVAFSSDGTRLASGSYDNTIKLWEAATGREVAILQGHSDRVSSIAFSPDGKRLASGSDDKTIKLWDTATGREVATFQGHSAAVASVAFSPDGKRLASGASEWRKSGEIKLWDTQSGVELLPLEGDSLWVRSVAFSQDGTRLVSGARNGIIKLWEAATGRELADLLGHSDRVTSVAYSPDGCRVASGSWDRKVKVWDVTSGKAVFTLEGHLDTVTTVAFNLEGTRLASGSDDSTVKLWDAPTGRELATLRGHSREVTSVAFSPDGSRVASGSNDQTVKLWDAVTGKELATFQGHSLGVTSVAFSPDGKYIASGAEDKTVVLWDVTSGKEIDSLDGHGGAVTSVTFSPDGKLIASGSEDKTVRLWDATHYYRKAEGKELFKGGRSSSLSVPQKAIAVETPSGRGRFVAAIDLPNDTVVLKGHTNAVTSVAFLPDGSCLASGSADGIRLWDEASGKEIVSLQDLGSVVTSLAFSPDGSRLATGSWKSVRLWDAASSTEIISIKKDGIKLWNADLRETISRYFESSDSITGAAFSPNGMLVAVGTDDNRVTLWDAATATKLASLQGHADAVACVAFSPDGLRFASGSKDRTVKLWDAITGKELATLQGHSSEVTSVAFSPDGTRIASATEDKMVKLWDAVSAKEIATLDMFSRNGGRSIILSPFIVAFSPDGTRIVLASENVTLWDAKSGQKLAAFKGYSNRVVSVGFSPDGFRVACEWIDKTVKLWDTLSGKELPGEPDFHLVGNSISASRNGKSQARALGSQVIIESTGIILPDLVHLQRQNLFRLEGRKITWTTANPLLFSGVSFTPVFHRQDELAALASEGLVEPRRDQLRLKLLAKGARWRAAVLHWRSIQNPDAAARQTYLTLLLSQAFKEAGKDKATALATLLPEIAAAMTGEAIVDPRVSLPLVSLLSALPAGDDPQVATLREKVRSIAPESILKAITQP